MHTIARIPQLTTLTILSSAFAPFEYVPLALIPSRLKSSFVSKYGEGVLLYRIRYIAN